MKVYLAGPMSGYFNYNHDAFNAAAADLAARGFDVVNPAALDVTLGECPTYADYYRRDVVYLARCEGVVVLPGWRKSTGAKYELASAKTFDMPVFEYPSLRRLAPSELPSIGLNQGGE